MWTQCRFFRMQQYTSVRLRDYFQTAKYLQAEMISDNEQGNEAKLTKSDKWDPCRVMITYETFAQNVSYN